MNPVLLKIMAVGLTLSQLFNKPVDQVKLAFNPEADEAEVAQALKDGCTFMTKHFQAENLNLEVLLSLMISNAKAKADAAPPVVPDDPTQIPIPATEPPKNESMTMRMGKQLDFSALLTAYKLYCKNEKVEAKGLDLKEVIRFYNATMKDLPDVKMLVNYRLPESATVLDSSGQRFSEIYSDKGRRVFVPISQIPEHVKRAFISAEDKNFYSHHGLDVIGIIRAFSSVLMAQGRPQGGSTITQQVIKNLVLNDDVTFERKMREMVLAAQLEKVLSKDQILELYLNFIFLGRTSWGVQMASKSYFGKSVSELNYAEAALLAGLTKGPTYYNPDTQPERAKDRRQYVLNRMKDDGLDAGQVTAAMSQPIQLTSFESPNSRGGYYLLDAIRREAKEKNLLGRPFVVRSTLHTELQKITERALQDGLADYEAEASRARFTGVNGSIAKEIVEEKASWQDILPKVQGKLYDVHWPLATVLDVRKGTVGLKDGRVASLQAPGSVLKYLKTYDLVFVEIEEQKKGPRAILKVPPLVQGAVVVIENKTGRVLALTGGFSYAASQLNRALDSARQPGSTLKPFIHLAALNLGFQPNTLIPDMPVSLAPIERGGKYWSPKNYDGASRGLVTMRTTVEQSLNLPTVRIMSELGQTPTEGLDYVRAITQELGIYEKPERYYPFVLGAQPARLIDMAAAYATIANDGLRPNVHFIEAMGETAQNMSAVGDSSLKPVPSIDRVAFYQMRRILQGTIVRGTATKLKDLEGFVGAKTGTSNNENDAWFIGFTNDITVAVWMGYDNRNIRANLGRRFTGGRVALPIAETILRESFNVYKAKAPLEQPPAEIRTLIADYKVSLASGGFDEGNFVEIFRRDTGGQNIINTQRRILRGNESYLDYGAPSSEEDNTYGAPQLADGDQWRRGDPYGRQRYPGDYYQPGYDNSYESRRNRRRRVDPYLQQGFPWNNPFSPFGGY